MVGCVSVVEGGASVVIQKQQGQMSHCHKWQISFSTIFTNMNISNIEYIHSILDAP
jgi:hypothetical protein